MSVRTNWHLDGLDALDDGSDPMQEISELKSTGKVIDLSRSEAELSAELKRSLKLENYLYVNHNLMCSLKANSDHVVWGGNGHSCYGCQHFRRDPEDLRSLICREGRRQESILAEMGAINEGDRLDAELIAAFERDMAACDDLVAMCDSPALAI